MSMSRTAIQDRPMRPCTRFEATQARTTTKVSATRYLTSTAAVGPVTGTPNTVRSGTSIAPEAL